MTNKTIIRVFVRLPNYIVTKMEAKPFSEYSAVSNEEKATEKARQLLLEAEKKLTTKSFFERIFGSGSNKSERAMECYEKAGNLFKLSKNWEEAGDAFIKAANLKNISKHDIAQNYVSAANCYRKLDANKAVNCLLKAIEIYTDLGKFILAASNHEKIAQIYETSSSDFRQAIQHYEQAADYYKGEENDTSAEKCLIKAAHYYSKEFSEYMKAIEIYEEVAISETRSTLLKYSVKTYFFQAALCYLCMDVASAQKAIQKYLQIFPAFGDSREYSFLKKMIECIENDDVEDFTMAVANYDKVSRLEPWFVTILLRIKNKFSEHPNIR